uniref:Rhodanese domain protein n=1 Tax=Cyanothece sp. (strain PCC 7425 / ATCC 29141) TaxID=395961 RepID=B8HXZ5_CYAP4
MASSIINSATTTTTVVSPQWLFGHLQAPDIVIVDCRFALNDPEWGQQQYNRGHLPGAYFLDLNRDLSRPVSLHGGRHPLPDPIVLADKLNQIGLTAQTLVVAYDDARFAFAARLWWLLRWLGHERVAVLDGGLPAYLAAGYPLTPDLPPPRPGQFVPQVQSEKVVGIDGVRASQDLPDVVLIDAREQERYRGEREPIDPIAGHIPGAVNYCWKNVTDEQGHLRSPQDLQAYWSEVVSAEEIIVYCGSGVTACVNLLALEAAGIKTAKLYAGSWSDWCSYLV